MLPTTLAVERALCNCPSCGFGDDEMGSEGETLDHAYGSCLELGTFWHWMVATFLIPVGCQCAARRDTTAAHLVGVVSPEVLAGMLGLITQAREDASLSARERAKSASYKHGWWAMVRGAALAVIERYRKRCRKLFKQYGDHFQRPGLHILQDQVRDRLRLRVQEEVSAVRSGKLTGGEVGLGPEGRHILYTGVLLGGVLGHVSPITKQVVLSKLIGGEGLVGRQVWAARVTLRSPPLHAGPPQEDHGGVKGIINFDGAANSPRNGGSQGIEDTVFGTKCATDNHRNDPHFGFGDAEQPGDFVTYTKLALGAGVDGDFATEGMGLGDDGMGLEVTLMHHGCGVVVFEHNVGASNGFVDITTTKLGFFVDVGRGTMTRITAFVDGGVGCSQVETVFGQTVRPNQGCIGGNRISHIAQYGKGFVVYDYCVGAIFGSSFCFGDDHHDGVTAKQNFVVSQYRT